MHQNLADQHQLGVCIPNRTYISIKFVSVTTFIYLFQKQRQSVFSKVQTYKLAYKNMWNLFNFYFYFYFGITNLRQ